MPRIYVEFAELKQFGDNCKIVSYKVDDIKSDFQRTVRQLDWDVRYASDINATANQLAKKLDCYTQVLKKYQTFIMESYNAYAELDSERLDRISDFTTEKNDTSGMDADAQFLAWLKSILKWMHKSKTNDKAGIASGGISYLESLYNFFTGDMKGLTGAKDWFDLADSSITLWTEFYKYLKKFYNNTGSLFSVENQTKVAGLGIAGSTLGLFSSMFGAVDTIKNTEGIGVAGIIGQVLGVGGDVVDIWASVERLKHVGDAAANITTESGIYNPLMFYTTIAKGYLSTFAQGFTSYEKYAADGVWDLKDTASTGIESSVAGLYSMVSSLTFGLISEKTTGIRAEDISNFLENGAGNIGTRAGNYILNDSSLYETYQNSNAIGKAVITFYAAFRSW